MKQVSGRRGHASANLDSKPGAIPRVVRTLPESSTGSDIARVARLATHAGTAGPFPAAIEDAIAPGAATRRPALNFCILGVGAGGARRSARGLGGERSTAPGRGSAGQL